MKAPYKGYIGSFHKVLRWDIARLVFRIHKDSPQGLHIRDLYGISIRSL